MDLKPIETIYNGNRFRSRLEARWAVFFDIIEEEYQYEPEGFEFSDGTKYLPDFYLPKHDLYCEIKGIGALTLKDGQVINGRENNFKYVIAKSEIEDAGKTYAILCGSPYDIISKKHGAFIWGSFATDRLFINYEKEAEFSQFVRFEHGESPSDYAVEYIKKKILDSGRESRALLPIAGLLIMHPSYAQEIVFEGVMQAWIDLMRYFHENESVFKKTVLLIDSANGSYNGPDYVIDIPLADTAETFDILVQQEIYCRLSFIERAAYDYALRNRKELSHNDYDTFIAYLLAWKREKDALNDPNSLESIIKKRRYGVVS